MKEGAFPIPKDGENRVLACQNREVETVKKLWGTFNGQRRCIQKADGGKNVFPYLIVISLQSIDADR